MSNIAKTVKTVKPVKTVKTVKPVKTVKTIKTDSIKNNVKIINNENNEINSIEKQEQLLTEQIDKDKDKDKNKDKNKKYVVLDLFCGCGGMSKGLVDSGFTIFAGIDIWSEVIANYKKNYEHLAVCEDLKKLSPQEFNKTYNKENKKIDIIVGGPPCQGFSIAGKRDTKDPRNSLFMEYIKYLDFYEPQAFIMENVVGILSMKTEKKENVIDIIKEQLEKNYNIIITKLLASDFEVPQNRKRVIIIGLHKKLKKTPYAPTPILTKSEHIPVKNILLKKENIDKKYFLTEKAITGINNKKQKSLEKGAGFGAQFLDMDKPSYTIPARYWKDGYDALVKYSDNEIRRLTIIELKRIQTFPDEYILEGSNKNIIMQIGNAVACKFAFYLGKHLLKLLN